MYSTRWMDEGVVTSEKCWIGIEKKIDAGDRRRNVLNGLIENVTALNALEGKFGKKLEK